MKIFDMIVIDNNTIRFSQQRNLTTLESLSAKIFLGKPYIDDEEYGYKPKTIKQFLNCLSKTKIIDNEQYLIINNDADENSNLEQVVEIFLKENPVELTKQQLIEKANSIKAKAILEEKTKSMNDFSK